ncbi:MAG: hypothetical protein V4466_14985 [Pseudomonadota bacterium]
MTTPNPRLWAILTALAGIAVVAVSLSFALLPEVVAGQAAGCYGKTPPVVAFEFARTVAEASVLFGDGDCRALSLAAMDAINTADIRVYIPAYTLFAIFGAVFAARGARPPLVLLAILVAIVAFVADRVETTTLLAATKDLDAAGALLPRSSAAAWAKFAALAVHGLLVAGVCLRAPRRWIVCLAMTLPAAGVIAAAIDPAAYATLMMLGLTVGWLVLLAFALKESVWLPKRRGTADSRDM